MPESAKEKIQPEQIAEEAARAVLATEGVSSLYVLPKDYLAENILGKNDRFPGIRMSRSAGVCSFDIFCEVQYGCRIPETAWNIQENVKNRIELKYGCSVGKINIHIEGISKKQGEKDA